MTENTPSSLRVSVCAIEGAVYTRDNIPLRIVFESTGEGGIRLLRHFEPLPVFFAFRIVREDGTPIGIPGAGKIDFREGSIRYLVLNSRETFGILVDLAEIIPSPEDVTEGDYEISVTYHNQYGEDCFRGKIGSDPINVKIAAP